jgi:uncharacterized protein with HEPN domain
VKDDGVYLVHISECIRKIEQNTSAGKAAFLASETLQDAVLRNLQVMCESTQMLSAEWKAARSDVDWRRIADFRNRLVHDYLGVDLEIVWNVVAEDVPELKRVTMTAVLSTEPPAESQEE